jgi:simple sugar transport system substrate-binding protein
MIVYLDSLHEEVTMKKRLIKCLVYCLALFLLFNTALYATGQKEVTPAGKPAGEYTFYIVTHVGPADPWAGGAFNSGVQAAKKYYGVNIQWLGPESFSVQKMVDMLETAIAAKPDGLVVAIPDVNALEEPINRAVNEGIPVISINVGDTETVKGRIPILCYIGGNEYQMGYQAGMRMLREFEPSKPKRGVVLQFLPGHIGLEQRAKGFADAFATKNVPVDKVAGSPNASESYQALDAYLTRHPDTDAVFTPGPLGAHPSLRLFKDKNLFGKIKIGTVDLTPTILNAIKEGQMVFAVDQQPYLQPFLAIGFLILYKEYGLSPVMDVLTGPAIVDSTNVSQVEAMVDEVIR